MELPGIFHLAILASTLSICLGLECYVCHTQDSNKDKCIKTTKQCEKDEEICMSSIAWKIPPYWVPHADRIHYISKGCAKWDECKERRQELYDKNYCKRDWFNDWQCVECCSGDLCNYYVTLGASSTKASLFTVLAIGVAYIFTKFLSRA